MRVLATHPARTRAAPGQQAAASCTLQVARPDSCKHVSNVPVPPAPQTSAGCRTQDPPHLDEVVAVPRPRAHGARAEQVLPSGQLKHHAAQAPDVGGRAKTGGQDDLAGGRRGRRGGWLRFYLRAGAAWPVARSRRCRRNAGYRLQRPERAQGRGARTLRKLPRGPPACPHLWRAVRPRLHLGRQALAVGPHRVAEIHQLALGAQQAGLQVSQVHLWRGGRGRAEAQVSRVESFAELGR